VGEKQLEKTIKVDVNNSLRRQQVASEDEKFYPQTTLEGIMKHLKFYEEYSGDEVRASRSKNAFYYQVSCCCSITSFTCRTQGHYNSGSGGLHSR